MKKIMFILMVLAMFFLGCNNEKTIEKDGGINISMEINCGDLLNEMCNIPQDSIFQLSIQKTKTEQFESIDDLLHSFYKYVQENDSMIQLASYFSTFELKDKISYQSTNEQVINVIKSEIQKEIDKTVINVTKRIEYFAEQPIIVKTIKFNSFQVEIPGITDQQRICNYLQSNGNLEFWETYNNEEIFQYLDGANKKILELGLVQEKPITDTIKKEMSLEEEMNAKRNQEMNDYCKSNPLFAILAPSTYAEKKLMSGPCIGRCSAKDTSIVNKYLGNKIIKNSFPRDVKFCWSYKPIEQNTKVYELIALKISQRDGKAPLNGESIADASSETDQYSSGENVSITMNNDGAQIWARLTAENVGKSIAIVLDNYVYSYPVVQSEIKGGKSTISGRFSTEEAHDLANILKAGRYPAKVLITNFEIIKPGKK